MYTFSISLILLQIKGIQFSSILSSFFFYFQIWFLNNLSVKGSNNFSDSIFRKFFFFFFSLSLTLFEFSSVMIVKYSEFEEYLPVGECNVYKNLRLF